jgi:hypothetical protein
MPDGRFYGLVVGANTVLAEILPSPNAQVPPGKTSAQIVITNHRMGGPVFSGAQPEPWICAHTVATAVPVTIPGPPSPLFANVTSRVSGLDVDPIDDQCNATAKSTHFYQPKATEGTSCTFMPRMAGRRSRTVRAASPSVIRPSRSTGAPGADPPTAYVGGFTLTPGATRSRRA